MLQMPPPWLLRSAIWFGGLVPALLGAVLLVSEGLKSGYGWLFLLTSAIVLVPMFWKRPSKARKVFVMGALVYSAVMVGWGLTTTRASGSPVDDLRVLLFAGLCCIVAGAFLVSLGVWLHNRLATGAK